MDRVTSADKTGNIVVGTNAIYFENNNLSDWTGTATIYTNSTIVKSGSYSLYYNDTGSGTRTYVLDRVSNIDNNVSFSFETYITGPWSNADYDERKITFNRDSGVPVYLGFRINDATLRSFYSNNGTATNILAENPYKNTWINWRYDFRKYSPSDNKSYFDLYRAGVKVVDNYSFSGSMNFTNITLSQSLTESGDDLYIDDIRIWNATSGNLTVQYDAGVGNETFMIKVYAITPDNTTYDVGAYNNTDGTILQSWLSQTGIQTLVLTGSKAQNTTINVTLNAYGSATPEIVNVTLYLHAVGAGPNITAWENNKTNNDALEFSLNKSEAVMFNITVNESITDYIWKNNGVEQSNNFNNYTTSWNTTGTKIVSVVAINDNGSTQTIQWNITIPCNDTVQINPGDSIQNAIDNFCDGTPSHSIELLDGTHNTTQLIVNKSNTIIFGTKNAVVNKTSGSYLFYIDYRNNSNNTLTNMTFRGFTTQSGLFFAVGVRNLTLDGITGGYFLVRSAQDNGCNLYNYDVNLSNNRNLTYVGFLCTNNIIVRNNTIYQSIDLNQNNNYINISDNPWIADNQYNWGIRLHGGPTYVYIYNNNIFTGVTPGGNGAIMADSGDHFWIYNNTLTSNGARKIWGVYINPQQAVANFSFYNNRMYNLDYGFYFYNYQYGYSGENTVVNITNNVLYNFTYDAIWINISEGGKTNIRNNIIANASRYGINYVAFNPSYPSNWSYNDIWGSGTANYNNTVAGVGDISADPLFANASSGDFHLKSQAGRWNGTDWVTDAQTSPAIDAGDPSDNYSLEPEPNGDRINMGAYGGTSEASKTYSASSLTACTDLSTANTYYTLTQNVSSAGTCFNVLADNVTLDGAGYWVNYSQAVVGYGVNITGRNNVTVKNLRVVQGNSSVANTHAIYLSGTTNSNVTNNTMRSSASGSIGIYLLSSSNSNDISINNITTYSGSGLYVSASNSNLIHNNNMTTTGNAEGIFMLSGNSNNFLNNTLLTSSASAYGIQLRGSNTSITGGSIIAKNAASYDYYLRDAGTTNNFTNTNFTADRKIYFYDSTSWFNYNNETSGSIWLKTNLSAQGAINRTLANWNNTLMQWNDTVSGVTANYNLIGLLASTQYRIYNTSAGTETNTYNLTTDSSGNLNSFTIALNGNTEIKIIASSDITLPAYSLNSTNSTVAGKSIMHSLYWSDNIGLSSYIFSFDNCTESFSNISSASFSGQGNWSNVSVAINSTVGCTIRWRVYANDTNNNWNESLVYSYVTTAVIDTPPTYSNTGVNNTIANRSTTFYAYWTDDNGLSEFIFSTNNNGTWVNDSWAPFSGTGNWSNVTKMLNPAVGISVSYRFYSNDTLNNWTDTGVLTIATTNENGGRNLYVATYGNNSNLGTLDAPWQNLTYAVPQLSAGDTLYLIDSGTPWDETMIVFNNSGNATHRITMTAYNGTPTIQGNWNLPYDSSLTVIRNNYHNYITVSNITIKNFNVSGGIDLFGNYLIVDNVTLINISSGTSGSGMIDVAGHDITISNNWLQQFGRNNLQVYTYYRTVNGSRADFDTYNVSIINNTILDSNYGPLDFGNMNCGTGADYEYCINSSIAPHLYDITVRGNTIDCSLHNTGCFFPHGNYPWYMYGINFSDNVFIGGTYGLDTEYLSNSLIEDNIFYNFTSYGLGAGASVKVNDGVTYRNNTVYASATDVYFNINTTATVHLIENDFRIPSFSIKYGHAKVRDHKNTTYSIPLYYNSTLDLGYSTNAVFSESVTNPTRVIQRGIRYYPTESNDSFVHTAGGSGATIAVTTYNMTARPSSGYLNITVNKFNTTTDTYNITVNSSVAENPTWFNLTAKNANSFYNIKRDGSLYTTIQSGADSVVRFFYNASGDDWSSHTFEFTEGSQGLTASLNSPVNSLVTNNATVAFNCSSTSANQLTNITLYGNWSGWSPKNTTNITGTSNSSQWVNTLSDGSYIWNCLAYDNTGNSSFYSQNYTLTIDTAPPMSVTNLQNQSQSDSWIYWNWTNPGDFNHSEIYLNGTWQANTSNNYYNATNLTQNTEYQISIRTVDLAGNINTTWVNSTARTTSDTTPPVINVTYPTNGTAFAAGKTETWINITTDENATCRYSTNASFVFADGTNFTNTGSMNHSFLYSGLTDNTAYGLYYLCNDTYSNVNTQATYHTFSVSSAAVTPTTPSGGGGGSGGSTTTKTITVMPNEPLTKVIVNLKQSLDSPSLTVAKVESVPVSTPTEPVYQYINITKSRFNNTQIENATIDFKVNRSWISANNFTKIYLAHYDNGWNKLRTDLVNSTATTNYYRAYTNAFSYFAIIGEKAPTPENPSGIPPAEEQKEEQPQETPKVETQGQPEVQEKKTPYFAYIIAAIVLIIAAYALSIKAKEKSRDSEEPISEPVKRETPKKPISQKRAKEDNIDDIQKRLEEIRKKLNQKS